MDTVTHQKGGTQQTVLELDGAPFMTVLHRAGNTGADFDPTDRRPSDRRDINAKNRKTLTEKPAPVRQGGFFISRNPTDCLVHRILAIRATSVT